MNRTTCIGVCAAAVGLLAAAIPAAIGNAPAAGESVSVVMTVVDSNNKPIPNVPCIFAAPSVRDVAFSGPDGRAIGTLELSDGSSRIVCSIDPWTNMFEIATPQQITQSENRFQELQGAYAWPVLIWTDEQPANGELRLRTQLKPGVEISGRVVDESGAPLPAAIATFGYGAYAAYEESKPAPFALKGVPQAEATTLVVMEANELVWFTYHELTAAQTSTNANVGDLQVRGRLDRDVTAKISVQLDAPLSDRDDRGLGHFLTLVSADGNSIFGLHVNSVGQAYDPKLDYFGREPLTVPDLPPKI